MLLKVGVVSILSSSNSSSLFFSLSLSLSLSFKPCSSRLYLNDFDVRKWLAGGGGWLEWLTVDNLAIAVR